MFGTYVDTWRAFEELQADGRIRSIGVSNFEVEHIERLAAETSVVPAVNQIELHPQFPQAELRAYHAAHGIQPDRGERRRPRLRADRGGSGPDRGGRLG